MGNKKENLQDDYLKELMIKTIESEHCKEKAIVYFNPNLNEVYEKEIQKLKDHYADSSVISFAENESLGNDEIEIETSSKFLKVGIDSQLKIIDEIFDNFQETANV